MFPGFVYVDARSESESISTSKWWPSVGFVYVDASICANLDSSSRVRDDEYADRAAVGLVKNEGRGEVTFVSILPSHDKAVTGGAPSFSFCRDDDEGLVRNEGRGEVKLVSIFVKAVEIGGTPSLSFCREDDDESLVKMDDKGDIM